MCILANIATVFWGKKVQVCNVGQFPWCKYARCADFKIQMTALSEEEEEVNSAQDPAGRSPAEPAQHP